MAEPLGAAGGTDAFQCVCLEIKHLLDHDRGNRVVASAGTHQQSLGDRERERDEQTELGAFAVLGGDFDAAAEAGHFALDHVHANAAPGNLRDFGGG